MLHGYGSTIDRHNTSLDQRPVQLASYLKLILAWIKILPTRNDRNHVDRGWLASLGVKERTSLLIIFLLIWRDTTAPSVTVLTL